MRVVWVIGGGGVGLAVGAVAGFGVALAAMSMSPPRIDGTYGMREVLVCLPGGAIIGLIAGVTWGLRTSFAID